MAANDGPAWVEWEDSVTWTGRIEDGHFHVEDIQEPDSDAGRSYRQLTGQAPALKPVPLDAITAKGGKVLSE